LLDELGRLAPFAARGGQVGRQRVLEARGQLGRETLDRDLLDAHAALRAAREGGAAARLLEHGRDQRGLAPGAGQQRAQVQRLAARPQPERHARAIPLQAQARLALRVGQPGRIERSQALGHDAPHAQAAPRQRLDPGRDLAPARGRDQPALARATRCADSSERARGVEHVLGLGLGQRAGLAHEDASELDRRQLGQEQQAQRDAPFRQREHDVAQLPARGKARGQGRIGEAGNPFRRELGLAVQEPVRAALEPFDAPGVQHEHGVLARLEIAGRPGGRHGVGTRRLRHRRVRRTP
jgi:hypothetical protein